MNWRNVQEVIGDYASLWHTDGLPKYSLLVGNNILAIKIGFETYKPLNRSNNCGKYGDKLEVVSSHVSWVTLFIVEILVVMRYFSVDNCCMYWRWICWDVCMCKYGYCVSLGRSLFCFFFFASVLIPTQFCCACWLLCNNFFTMYRRVLSFILWME